MDEPPDQPAAAVHRATRRPLEPASSHSPNLGAHRSRASGVLPGRGEGQRDVADDAAGTDRFDRPRRPDARWVGRHHVERTRLDDVEVIALGAVSVEGFTGGHDTRFHVLDRRGQHRALGALERRMRLQRRHEPRQPRRPARVGAQGLAPANRSIGVSNRRTLPVAPAPPPELLLAPRVPARAGGATAPRASRSQLPWGLVAPVLRTRVFSPGLSVFVAVFVAVALSLALRLEFLRVEQLVRHVSPRMDAGRVRALAFHERRRRGRTAPPRAGRAGRARARRVPPAAATVPAAAIIRRRRRHRRDHPRDVRIPRTHRRGPLRFARLHDSRRGLARRPTHSTPRARRLFEHARKRLPPDERELRPVDVLAASHRRLERQAPFDFIPDFITL